MKIKRYKGKNFTEVLEKVKEDLGSEAVIISTEEKKGLRPYVEITAAVDYENSFEYYRGRRTQLQESTKASDERLISTDAFNLSIDSVKKDSMVETILKEIKKELDELRVRIEQMHNQGYEVRLPAEKRRVFYFLRQRAIKEEFAMLLTEKSKGIESLPEIISSKLKIARTSFSKKAIVLVGPTGVGKTTTLAKLAAMAVREGKKAGIINLDTYRIGAIEQIRIYSRVLGIPLKIAADVDELRVSFRELSDRDVLFIDTVGRGPFDTNYIEKLNGLLQSFHPETEGFRIETHLLFAVNSDEQMLIDAALSYKVLPVDSIAFTKLDESVRFGCIFNVALLYNKAIAYVTTGQSVPEDIEFPDAQGLANLILSKGVQNQRGEAPQSGTP